MDWNRSAHLVLRAGVAFAFLYPPISAVFSPLDWIGYFPPAFRGIVPDLVLLHGFGLLEVIIALWILSGKKIFWPSAAASTILLSIVVSDFHDFIVIFRDISIAAAAGALAIKDIPNAFPTWDERE